mmetsp:Transcript_3564/g.7309  ORF Transcript_3564/g.7309 Transcript_3564/m.7309 type:complete len:202 (-) Transcript_3564:1435-2040(-)
MTTTSTVSKLITASAMLGSPITVESFVPSRSMTLGSPSGTRIPTSLNLEDHIANMIDNELYRLNRKEEADEEWLEKQREWSRMEPKLPENFDFEEIIDPNGSDSSDNDAAMSAVPGFSSGVNRSVSSPLRRKDKRMAENDPMRYCADRCVATGNCDVFEDMFEMGPDEVIKFCKECVLSEDEEPCDIPETIFRDDGMGVHP